LSELVPIEATASLRGVDRPLKEFVADIVEATVDRLGLMSPDEVVDQLGTRWSGGRRSATPPRLTPGRISVAAW
jgi:hypothetical protein